MRSLDWFGLGMLAVFVLHGHYGTYDKIYNGVFEGLALQDSGFFERMAYELNGPKDFIGAMRTDEPLGFLFLHTLFSALVVQLMVWPLKILADIVKNMSSESEDLTDQERVEELEEPKDLASNSNPSPSSPWMRQSS